MGGRIEKVLSKLLRLNFQKVTSTIIIFFHLLHAFVRIAGKQVALASQNWIEVLLFPILWKDLGR